MDSSILKHHFLELLRQWVPIILHTSESDSVSVLARIANQIVGIGSPAVLAIHLKPSFVTC